MFKHFLGIKISTQNKKEILQMASGFLDSNKQNMIFTPNPEMLVKAQQDIYFREILNSSDLNICDGVGIKILSLNKFERFPGVDFLQELCKIGEEKEAGVYFLGSNSDEVAQKTAEELKNRFPNLKIAGYNKGPAIKEIKKNDRWGIAQSDDAESIIDDIIQKAPKILFVAFGNGKQEKWIYENLPDLPSVRIAVGVGGSFDFIAGRVERAPKFVRKIGLEWLFRLFKEPHRFFRIYNATIVFCYYFLKHKIKKIL